MAAKQPKPKKIRIGPRLKLTGPTADRYNATRIVLNLSTSALLQEAIKVYFQTLTGTQKNSVYAIVEEVTKHVVKPENEQLLLNLTTAQQDKQATPAVLKRVSQSCNFVPRTLVKSNVFTGVTLVDMKAIQYNALRQATGLDNQTLLSRALTAHSMALDPEIQELIEIVAANFTKNRPSSEVPNNVQENIILEDERIQKEQAVKKPAKKKTKTKEPKKKTSDTKAKSKTTAAKTEAPKAAAELTNPKPSIQSKTIPAPKPDITKPTTYTTMSVGDRELKTSTAKPKL